MNNSHWKFILFVLAVVLGMAFIMQKTAMLGIMCLGWALACLNFVAGYQIKKKALGKSLDQFFKWAVGLNGLRMAFFFSAVLVLIRHSPANFSPVLLSVGISYFLFQLYELKLLYGNSLEELSAKAIE